MDRTHPRKTNHGYNKTRPGVKPSGEKDRKTKKHTAKVEVTVNVTLLAVEDEAKKAGKSWPQITKDG